LFAGTKLRKLWCNGIPYLWGFRAGKELNERTRQIERAKRMKTICPLKSWWKLGKPHVLLAPIARRWILPNKKTRGEHYALITNKQTFRLAITMWECGSMLTGTMFQLIWNSIPANKEQGSS